VPRTIFEKASLRRQDPIETVFAESSHPCQAKPIRHQSQASFPVNLRAGIMAYPGL
jgi:hypothetical protein